MLVERVRQMLRRAGIEVTRHPAPGTLAWQIKQVLRLRAVDAVIDVGAHHGEFARRLRNEVGFTGQIVSFEPSSVSFGHLSAAMHGDPLWSGHRLALGSTDGVAELNLQPSSDLNSIRRETALGIERFALEHGTSETVSVRRLDQTTLPDGRLLLKSDTQGFDLEVFDGARGILHRVAAVVMELPVRNAYEGAPGFVEMIERLASAGFELVGLFPVARDRDRLRVIEFDGVFVNINLSERHRNVPS